MLENFSIVNICCKILSKFKTTIKSSLCVYGDSHILMKWNITVTGAGADMPAKQEDEW